MFFVKSLNKRRCDIDDDNIEFTKLSSTSSSIRVFIKFSITDSNNDKKDFSSIKNYLNFFEMFLNFQASISKARRISFAFYDF